MLQKVPALDSQVIRALIVAGVGVIGVICSFFGVDEALFSSEKVQRLADGVATLATLIGVVWAAWARATKPTPPITNIAADKTAEAVKAGELKKQGGFLRLGFAPLLAAVALAAVVGGGVAGCTGTQAAFKAAQTRPETVLPDTAYVVAEQYRALLKEAADLKESGRLPPEVVQRLQDAARVGTPLVIGDPQATPPKPGLQQLSQAFQSVRTAETEADLQRAVDAAVLAVADFLRAVEAARGVR